MRIIRQHIHINGIVQGVGFRPFIYRIAKQCHLSGFVNNNSSGVYIEIQGPADSIETFHKKLINEAPPFATIISVKKENADVIEDSDFKIIESDSSDKANTLISPDIAVCQDCLQELFDPANRRYQYPFINCTNCGPRYTIIKTIPYDRPFTSMSVFKMCAECQKEYIDPLNRRFHAQPNACPKCGPQLFLTDRNSNNIDYENIIKKAAQLISAGYILAIRGLGGFHLAVDPFNPEALENLRARKGRQAKPFALMARDIGAVEKYCHVSHKEKESLSQPTNPIVILRKLEKSLICEQVAPTNNYLAFMLPYTPLHHLLMQYFDVLVMTSANFTDEPITIGNEESFARLNNIADYFLYHNRDIVQRCDDSIVRIIADRQVIIRRSRGFVPAPVFIKENTAKNILAVGGELKNTIALARGNEIYFSQHIGDLDNPAAYNFFENSVAHLQDIFQIKSEVIVCDMHPEYLSTKWAKQQDALLIEVQHHHAHLAAVLAENHIEEPAIGIILDGTGYGTDGTIWGGEVLVGDSRDYERYAWLDPVPLPGSAAAIKEPWRMAYSYLKKAFGDDINALDLPFLKDVSIKDRLILDQMLEKKINTPLTSSCGRLFDAVSAILNICRRVTFEAQAAIELEMFADDKISSYYVEVISGFRSFSANLNLDDLIKAIVRDYQNKKHLSEIVAMFHNTLAELLTRIVEEVYTKTRIDKVALSGGVFQNIYLFNILQRKLMDKKFRIITHKQVPPNDGGLALGQIAVACHSLI